MVFGIITEFNPFHNGHQALIRSARENGAKQIVCVMSGNCVERGSFAITDKRVRTRAALECGADLIIELPVAYAVGMAQHFAKGSVYLLNALGCMDVLAFGSESGELGHLYTLAKAIDSDEVTPVMRSLLREGLTFAKARELAVKNVYGEGLSGLLSEPNNILGIEYLRQMALQNVKAEALTIKRAGAGHDEETASNGFASASYLRANPDLDTLSPFVPEKALKIYSDAVLEGLFPSDSSKLDAAILSHLRRMNIPQLSALPDISEGLHNRMYSAIRSAVTLEGLTQAMKTKRYTMARVRRLILSAFLGITAADHKTIPPYVRVLGFNCEGRKLLSQIKNRCRLPVSASLADLRAKGGSCGRFAALEETSTDLYGLSLPNPIPCGYEYTAQAVFLH